MSSLLKNACNKYLAFVDKNKKWIELGFFIAFIALFFVPINSYTYSNETKISFSFTHIYFVILEAMSAENHYGKLALFYSTNIIIFALFLVCFVGFIVTFALKKKTIYTYFSYLIPAVLSTIFSDWLFSISIKTTHVNIYIYTVMMLIYLVYFITYKYLSSNNFKDKSKESS